MFIPWEIQCLRIFQLNIWKKKKLDEEEEEEVEEELFNARSSLQLADTSHGIGFNQANTKSIKWENYSANSESLILKNWSHFPLIYTVPHFAYLMNICYMGINEKKKTAKKLSVIFD